MSEAASGDQAWEILAHERTEMRQRIENLTQAVRIHREAAGKAGKLLDGAVDEALTFRGECERLERELSAVTEERRGLPVARDRRLRIARGW